MTDEQALSIQYFQEIVKKEEKNRNAPLAEELIATRSKLLIAKKKLEELKTKKKDQNLSKIKSAQARVDHYTKKVKTLEKKIRKKSAKRSK